MSATSLRMQVKSSATSALPRLTRPSAVSLLPRPAAPSISTPSPATSTVVAYMRMVGARSVSSTNVLWWKNSRVMRSVRITTAPAASAADFSPSGTCMPLAKMMQ